MGNLSKEATNIVCYCYFTIPSAVDLRQSLFAEFYCSRNDIHNATQKRFQLEIKCAQIRSSIALNFHL